MADAAQLASLSDETPEGRSIVILAMLIGVFPVIAPLNVMALHSPESAILSAVIFNALIIVALIPLALKGVAFRHWARLPCFGGTS